MCRQCMCLPDRQGATGSATPRFRYGVRFIFAVRGSFAAATRVAISPIPISANVSIPDNVSLFDLLIPSDLPLSPL